MTFFHTRAPSSIAKNTVQIYTLSLGYGRCEKEHKVRHTKDIHYN